MFKIGDKVRITLGYHKGKTGTLLRKSMGGWVVRHDDNAVTTTNKPVNLVNDSKGSVQFERSLEIIEPDWSDIWDNN